MDERQAKITEGAGLDDSRVNQEFVDFLKKWSSPVLLALAAVFFGIFIYQRVQESRIAKVNEAFATLEAAIGSDVPDPRSLREVADEYEGVRAVSEIARLASADAYLASVRTGLQPGSAPGPDGEPLAEDILTEDDRAFMLNQATSLYRAVYDATKDDDNRQLFAVNAAFGLAATAASEGTPADAVPHYETAITHAERGKFAVLAELARARIEKINAGIEIPELLTNNELPPLPTPPTAPAAQDAPLPGNSLQLTPPSLDSGDSGTSALPDPFAGLDPAPSDDPKADPEADPQEDDE